MHHGTRILIACGCVLLSIASVVWCNSYSAEACRRRCIKNLVHISLAKLQFATRYGKTPGDIVSMGDIASYMKKTHLRCPCGGAYSVNPIGTEPTCSYTNAVQRRNGSIIVHRLPG